MVELRSNSQVQKNGIVLISGIGFNTSLTDVLVWTATATDNSTVGVFYIQESQINGTKSATLATSFVPIAPDRLRIDVQLTRFVELSTTTAPLGAQPPPVATIQ